MRSLLLGAVLVFGTLSGCTTSRPDLSQIAVAGMEAGRLDAAMTFELLQAIQASQASFERFRRSRMDRLVPLTVFRCSEAIGRFCVDRTIGGAARLRFSEHPDIEVARQKLIRELQQVSEHIPYDPWVVGQWVRYEVESRDFEGAIRAAQGCRATPRWWCSSLLGYAYHHAGYPAEADLSFTTAISAMPLANRQIWMDPTPILEPTYRTLYFALDPQEQANFRNNFWFLVDPLLAWPGNEVRSEHLARNVQRQFEFDSHSTEGTPWGMDLSELLLRYGSPSAWFRGNGAVRYAYELARPSWRESSNTEPEEETRIWLEEFGQGLIPADEEERVSPNNFDVLTVVVAAPPYGVRDILTQYSIAPQSLLPPPYFLFGVDSLDAEWDRIHQLPHAGHSIPMGEATAQWLTPLASQIALFSREDSTIVVAGYDLPAHGITRDIVVEVGLAFVGYLPVVERTVVLRPSSPLAGAVAGTIPTAPTLMSLEVSLPEENTLARVRRGLNPVLSTSTGQRFSDLLLLRGEAQLPDSLSEAVDAARGSNRVSPGETLGIYWEIYGLGDSDMTEVSMSLILRQPQPGGLRGLIERTGLFDSAVPVRTSWVEPAEDGPYMARSIAIQIPYTAEGIYTLELFAEVPGGASIRAERQIEVTRSLIQESSPGTMIRRPDLTRTTPCTGRTGMIYFPRCVYEVEPAWFGHDGGAERADWYGYD